MVLILVILTVAIFLLVERFLLPAEAALDQPLARPRAPAFAASRPRYLHPGHAWVALQGARSAVLGIADLAPRLLGRIERVDLPRVGDRVRQGEPFITLHRGTKSLRPVAPLSGVVREVNRALAAQPTLINDSPYERGWVARVEPAGLGTELTGLMSGALAEHWQEAARMELIRWFAPTPVPALPDGGPAVDDLSDRLGDDEWERLVREFFPPASRFETTDTH
ncbi:MAG: glycine cleavage system protein H [Candidatus Eisenbacteria bacterium]|nr:glycine cleavage system protein H [Candidatus Eisenbacteria bacterium]